MVKINSWYSIALPIVIACVATALVVGGLYTLNHPEKTYTKSTAKEYRVWHHDNDTVSTVATNYGVFIITDKELWNRLELNHTYTCEETYSNVSLTNCTEVRGV